MVRLEEQGIAQALAEVVRRFPSRRPRSAGGKSTVAVDATGLAPGSISTFLFAGVNIMVAPPCLGVTGSNGSCPAKLRLILAQKAHPGPINDCATLRPLLDQAATASSIGTVLADAAFDSERNHQHIRGQLGAESIIPAKRGTECVRKCARLSQPSATGNASRPKPSSVQSNANSPARHRVVRSPPNANKLSCSLWPTTSTASGLAKFSRCRSARLTSYYRSFSTVLDGF